VIKIFDVTLRDGNHALNHKIELYFIKKYCAIADRIGLWAIEVGHGNGLGASSYLVGKAKYSDFEMIENARMNLRATKLSVHSIPGFSTINKHLKPILKLGVDIVRVATNATEANTARKHIEFLKSQGVIVQGVLMMSHMISVNHLIEQSKLLESYGVDAVVLMDSAGAFTPKDLELRFMALQDNLEIEFGIHAHNNLGYGVTNAISSIGFGANIVDGATMELGAGAGNAQLEAILFNLLKTNSIYTNLEDLFELSKLVEKTYFQNLPRRTADSLLSGMYGVFSGYAPLVRALSKEFEISSTQLWKSIGSRNIVAGQESILREIAQELRSNRDKIE
jgi:4-hydroxy 2-oxovalerate aldolase